MDIIYFISNKLLIPLYSLYKLDKSNHFEGEINRFNGQNLERIRDFQLQRIRIIAKHAYDTTNYYRKLFKRIGLNHPETLTWNDYALIPLLTKDIIRKEGSNLLSSSFGISSMRHTATGGTTSSPLPIYSDWDSVFRKRSGTRVFDGWLGYKPGMKVALLWQARQDMLANNSLKGKVLNILVDRRLILPGSPLDESIMESYYKALLKFKPFLLQSYPTPLEIFAEFLKKRHYQLDIPAVSCTAEPLLDRQKELFLDVFRTVPYNWYGAREAGRIATECAHHNGMHINCYGLRADIYPSSFVADGLGQIIITDLWNTAMPLIKYDIGDVGCVTDVPCSCGCHLPRFTELFGRVGDTFVNSRGQKIPGVWFPNQFIKDCDEIQAIQILQHGIGTFEVRIVPGDKFNMATEKTVTDRLGEFMKEPCRVRITRVEEIPCEKSGKIRVCINLIDEAKSGRAHQGE